MKISDLIKIYETKKKKYGLQTYQYISDILKEAKAQHKENFQGKDHEQSWKAFKGKNLEKLVEYIIADEIKKLGLAIVNGNRLEKIKGGDLAKEFSLLKRNLLVDYGEFGAHLPDVDLIIYEPKTSNVIAVLSIKVTLRERVAQTGYWKIKLASDKVTKHIKVYFATLDEDNALQLKNPSKKGRAIIETDTDCGYVLSRAKIEESNKVKIFGKFLDDLKKLLKNPTN